MEREKVSERVEGKRKHVKYLVRFFVTDHRFGSRVRSQRLEVHEFLKFARHAVSKNAEVSFMERMRDFFRSDANSLIY